MNNYRLPDSLGREIEEFDALIKDFKQGKVNKIKMKAYRVPFGVYEQRKSGTYMIRVRCAAGYITPPQLKRVAELSKQYSSGILHLTTRQEVQIHNVAIDDIIPIEKALKEVGLSSRGGGGNTVRNIIGSEDAGTSNDEVFDITPYAIALTSRLIAEDDSWKLPRKYKIAFSGSAADTGYATINDLGFIAAVKDGQKGFKVYIAGGMGSKPAIGKVLYDFIPADEVYAVAKALKNLFYKYGNRKNKHMARIRFLWQKLGEDEFRNKFDEEYRAVKADGYEPLVIDEVENKNETADRLEGVTVYDHDAFSLWQKRYVSEQKQAGLYRVLLPFPLGDFDNDLAVSLADFLTAFGDNVIRLTKEQNILLRNIPGAFLGTVYQFVKDAIPASIRPVIGNRMIACTGANTCKLGICLSRNVTDRIAKGLDTGELDLDAIAAFKINISGCPNCCGQHFAADLGFFGKAGRNGDDMYPAYNVVAGANIIDDNPEYAEKLGEISAYDLPAFTLDFLETYIAKKDKYATYRDYLEKEGYEDITDLLTQYSDIPSFDDDKNYYFDWGAREIFSLASRGVGECSAGLFDLIDMDLTNVKDTRAKLDGEQDGPVRKKLLTELVFYTSRMLLITRGIEPKSADVVYESFIKEIIDTGYIDASFKSVIASAKKGDADALVRNETSVFELADAVKALYESMDDSLQFKTAVKQKAAATPAPDTSDAPVVKDFRGVPCPMNFVKTKLELAKIASGSRLEIYLDDGEPINNVPGSVKSEGHTIIEQKKVDDYWSVIIEKG